MDTRHKLKNDWSDLPQPSSVLNCRISNLGAEEH